MIWKILKGLRHKALGFLTTKYSKHAKEGGIYLATSAVAKDMADGKEPNAAEPQPNIYHEGHEEHEEDQPRMC